MGREPPPGQTIDLSGLFTTGAGGCQVFGGLTPATRCHTVWCMATDRAIRWATITSRVLGSAFLPCVAAIVAGYVSEHRWGYVATWATMGLCAAWGEWKGWRWEQWPRGTGALLRQQGELIREQQKTMAIYDAYVRLPSKTTRNQGDRPS